MLRFVEVQRRRGGGFPLVSFAPMTSLLLALIVAAEPAVPTRWTVSSFRETYVENGALARTVGTKSGWSCVVGKMSPGGARITVCTKGSEKLEFVTQCGDWAERDRVQVKLWSGDEGDAITVECQSGEAAKAFTSVTRQYPIAVQHIATGYVTAVSEAFGCELAKNKEFKMIGKKPICQYCSATVTKSCRDPETMQDR